MTCGVSTENQRLWVNIQIIFPCAVTKIHCCRSYFTVKSPRPRFSQLNHLLVGVGFQRETPLWLCDSVWLFAQNPNSFFSKRSIVRGKVFFKQQDISWPQKSISVCLSKSWDVQGESVNLWVLGPTEKTWSRIDTMGGEALGDGITVEARQAGKDYATSPPREAVMV